VNVVRFLGLTISRARPYKERVDIFDEVKQAERELRAARVGIERSKAELERERIQLQIEEERANLRELREELRGNPGESNTEEPIKDLESMLIPIIMAFLSKNGHSVAPIAGPPSAEAPPHTSTRSYSNDELLSLLKEVPSGTLKMARKVPDEIIKTHVRKYLPDADEDTISRSVTLIKKS